MSQNVSPSQWLAVAALAGGATNLEAAIAAKVNRRTIQRWLNNDTVFAQLLADELERTVGESLRVLKANATAAARLLVRGIGDEEVTAQQVRAADSILDRVHGKAIMRVGGAPEGDEPLRFVLIHPAAEKKLATGK